MVMLCQLLLTGTMKLVNTTSEIQASVGTLDILRKLYGKEALDLESEKPRDTLMVCLASLLLEDIRQLAIYRVHSVPTFNNRLTSN